LLEEAINYLKKTIEIQPKFYRFYNSLGVAFLKQENWDEAISYFKKAIELKPNLAWGYYNLGLIFSCQEKLETASNYFATAAKLNPSLLNTNLLDKYDNYLSKIGVAQWDIIQPIKCLITTESISIPENFKEELLTFNIDKLELTDGEETVQILLSGWIFGRQAKVISVQILHSNLLIQTVSMNVPRPDVLQNYPDYNLEFGKNTGFNTSWNILKSFISDKDELTLKAVFANNTSLPFKIILLNKKFAVSDRSDKKKPIDTIP
jgi:tetratricopeptide (TPR) repeat protein